MSATPSVYLQQDHIGKVAGTLGSWPGTTHRRNSAASRGFHTVNLHGGEGEFRQSCNVHGVAF